MQGGRVIEEKYNAPYNARSKTRMYSTTKSVTALAIGKLVGEGRLSLDDKVVDIFRDRFDMSAVHPLLAEQTVRHMLTMTTCYSAPTYTQARRDWLASYFSSTPSHPAGTLWHYDSCGSYVLGAIVKQITGLDFVEYLRPEFDVIGVSEGVYCLKGPDGESWVSSGLIAETADLAKMAYLLLNKGRWGDRQLIPEDYARDAISPLVRNGDLGVASRFDCGYGYQIWSHPGGAFAFRGLGGQIAIGYPGRDLVFACNSDTSCNHNAYDDVFAAVEELIAPAFPIIDPEEHNRLQYKPVTETVFDKIKNKSYALEKNPMGIDEVRFVPTEMGTVRFCYTRGGEEKSIEFAIDRETQIVFPESYWGMHLFDPERKMNYRCSTYAEWYQPNKLTVRVWAEDVYVGNLWMSFAFRDDGMLAISMKKYAQFFFEDFDGVAYGRLIEQK